MSLDELTSSEAVVEALRQCDVVDLGASVPGFGPTRDYVLEFGGKYYHPKQIASVAYGVQHPDRGALPATEFNKTAAEVAELLERLDFTITTTVELRPPKVGDEYPDRTAIYHAYGGIKYAGIIKFPRETVVNAFSDEKGPYSDEPPNLVTPFEYRGEGQTGKQRLDAPGNKMLEEARRKRHAVRYWYRPLGGVFRFVTWVAVLNRAQVWSPDNKKELRLEYAFQMMAVPSPDVDTWSSDVQSLIDDQEITDTSPPKPPAQNASKQARQKTYQQYLQDIGDPQNPDDEEPGPTRRGRNHYRRSVKSRQAVRVRANDECENDRCTGMPGDTKPDGSAILEVDHIDDRARGGSDHPTAMIALCPNCHAAKTYGRDRAAFKKHLRARLAALHR
ncbi:HNH endonuclease signature motif containing protein [Amycolatopsis sp. WAC 04182]|uniref:HNH endonuclease signature motif containing protein n=1 Tax=Amycolatopsis sp. WAC 04182 TaxID=2203198 RepID=UPI001315A914|nr:HNH endonuclease signature motif containing protein [Amycolatopsis sp. WAC 04182]